MLPDPAFIISSEGQHLACLGGAEPESYPDFSLLKGTFLYDVIPPEVAHWMLEQVTLCLEQQKVRVVEYEFTTEDLSAIGEDGPKGLVRLEGKVVPLTSVFNGKRAVLWLTRNITGRHKLEQKLRFLSETDELTGLYNRRYLQTKLKASLKPDLYQRNLGALIFIDVDLFKAINDQYGHPIGDLVLEQLGQRISLQLREEDIAARIGGEEFALLLPQVRLDEAIEVAERIRKAVAGHAIAAGESQLNVTVSAGVTLLSEADNISSAMSRADKALYQAKAQGRNRVEHA